MMCETGLELRSPCGDPRVIESSLSIPNEMYFGDMDKWVLRTMMKGKLPDKVRLNPKTGLQSADIQQRLYVHRDEMDRELAEMKTSDFTRIAAVDQMIADWEALKADYARFPHSKAGALLRHVAAYEFLRTL